MIRLILGGDIVEFLLCFSKLETSGIEKIDEQVGQDFDEYGELKSYTVILEKAEVLELIENIKSIINKNMSRLKDYILSGRLEDMREVLEFSTVQDCTKVLNQLSNNQTEID